MMAQRNSEYERIDGDLYVTPSWVFDALLSVEAFPSGRFDAAPVNPTFNFLSEVAEPKSAIVTNPPFSLAERFVRRSLELTELKRGKVAMLLPLAWDAAKTRRDLFERAPFKTKYTITKRIRWENLEQKKAGPSMNHAWFVWDWNHSGPPTMGWLP